MSDESPTRQDSPSPPAEPGRTAPAVPGAVPSTEQLTAAALDSVSEGFAVLDRDARFVFANPAAERFLQTSRAELIGSFFLDLFPEAASRRFVTEYRRAVAEKVPVHFEEFYPEPLNAWFEVRAYPSPEGLSVFLRDVTERRRIEDALRESEGRYRSILQTAMDGFWLADAEGRLLEVNEAYCRMSGYSAQELLTMRIADLEASESADQVAAHIRSVITRGADRFESQHRRKDGSTFDVEVSAHYSRAGAGRFVAFLRDVTERKRAEAALRERVEELRCLYSVADLVGNDGPLDEILQGTAERMPPGWCHNDIACARVVLDGREFKTRNFRTTRWSQASEIVLLGQPAGLVELCYLEERPVMDEGPFLKEERDLIDAIAERLSRVVERKRVDEALRTSEERHRTILLTALDGFWLVDTEGRLIEVNDAYCRMSGYSAQELLGMRIPDLEALETPEQTAARIQALMERGEERFESRHRRRDGSTFDVEVGVKYWPAGNGQFIVFLRDVSERTLASAKLAEAHREAVQDLKRRVEAEHALRRSEAALRDANDELAAANDALRRNNETLEARVAERTADLEHRTDQLRALALEFTRAEERERERVAQVIHDHLQQLLSLARINLDLARRQVRARSTQQRLDELDGLIAEALGITRSLTAELSPAILHRSGLAAALRWLGRWYEERFALEVSVEAEGDVQLDHEGRVTLFRAVRELLFNVVKHAQVARARVHLSQTVDGRARIVVRDEGAGFAPEILRATDATAEGFGLFSVRERLDMLGGQLEVTSSPGLGTSITITGPPPRPVPPGTPATPPVAPLNIAVRRRPRGRAGRPPSHRKP